MNSATPSAIIPAKWTIDDYHRMIAAGILSDRPVELLNGEIVEMSPEGEPHAYLSGRAANYLRDRLQGRAEIREAKPVTLPNQSEPEPDIAIVAPLDEEYFDHHPYPENIFWLVEYSHASLIKDLEIKCKTYAQAGIQEYWVVNLKQMVVVVFRDPDEGDYCEKRTFTDGEIYPVAFADVAIAVNHLVRR